MNSRALTVWLIDPSNFTIPYDKHLAEGLQVNGWVPVLFGRARRSDEDVLPQGLLFRSFFSRISDRVLSLKGMRRFGMALKAIEYFYDLIRLELAVRREKPTIVHFQWLVFPLLERVFLRRLARICPVVLTVHDTLPYLGSPSSSLQTVGWLDALRSADRLIVHLAASRQALVGAGVPAAKVVVIPHGVMKFDVLDADRPSYVPDDKLVMLLLGHVKPYKGVDILLDALALMEPGVRGEICVIVAGKHAAGMRSTAQDAQDMGLQDCVIVQDRFLSESEMAALLRASNVVIFPYKAIDASGVFFCAAADGKAVIATDVGVFSEVLKNNVNGMVVPPGDPRALQGAITELVLDRNRISVLAQGLQDTAKSSLSWMDIGIRTGALYDELRD